VPEIQAPNHTVVGGTVSGFSYISGSITYIDDMIVNLESVVSQNPSISGVVTPTIDWMKITKQKMSQNRIDLLSIGKSDLAGYEKSVKDYEELIDNLEVKEPQIQIFFEENPIIIDRGIKKLIPKKSFGGERFPDFIAVLHNDNHILIEVETPTKKIFTREGHPTSEFSQADQQIQDYLRWANEDKDFLRKISRKVPLPNISVENTSGLLIIGMSKNLGSEETRKLGRKKFECKNYVIKTFDELLSENQQVIDIIRKHSKR